MWLLMTLAFGGCDRTTLADLSQTQDGTIVILGERHGFKVDLGRAAELVRALTKQGHTVTVATEALHEKYAHEVQQFNDGEISVGSLKKKVQWSTSWGHAFKPYKKVLKTKGITVVAAGLDLGKKPEDREVELPEGYAERLKEQMKGHQMPPEIEARFATSMAWRDLRIAELAYEGWDKQGILVLLTGKGHVEGSQGSNWQMAKLTNKPIQSVILNIEDAQCLDGDVVWAD